MKSTKITGVFRDKKQLFTKNLNSCKGLKVYNEKIIKIKDQEYRSWNPYRSKLAAAILNGLGIKIGSNNKVLYLGAATGTTVSHVSDILSDGLIYAVEISPIAMKKLLTVCEKRNNIIPILETANHPDRYSHMVSSVDLLYQDISQRNQSEIFLTNTIRYLKKKGVGVLMVKARSIDVSLNPKKAYESVCKHLEKDGLIIHNVIDLKPYVKDHAAIVTSI